MKNYKDYIKIYKNYKKFEKEKKLVWSRFYLDNYEFEKRVGFVSKIIQDYVKRRFIIEIQFWERNDKMKLFLDKYEMPYSIIKEYNNNKYPGIIVIDDSDLDLSFFEKLLQNHYNYEHAIEPALSIKILLFIDNKDLIMIFDFYDDRGFIINYYYL